MGRFEELSVRIFSIWILLPAFSYAVLISFPYDGSTPLTLTRYNSTKITVELLIVCDKDFSELFKYDRQKIIDYWAIQIWDVNMRFKALTKSDITFKVHQLVFFDNTREQTFIELARSIDGAVSLQKTLENFAGWANRNAKKYADYDIAIVATAANKVEKASRSWAYGRATACKSAFGQRYSTVVIHFEHPWGEICGSVARPLSHILGAPPDSDATLSADCRGRGYLRDNDVCGKNQYFFSKCSDDGISEYIKLHHAECLHSVNDAGVDIITRDAKVTHPPSIHQQCELLTKSGNAVVGQEGDKCISTKCYIPDENGRLTAAGTLYPFENSPCDVNKFCFRGRCLNKGFPLRNPETGKCLHSSNRFSSNDSAIMADCLTSTTPLDTFMLLGSESFEYFLLATPYSSADANENADKCLGVDVANRQVRYSPCPLIDTGLLRWQLKSVNESSGEFLLFHVHSSTCAYVDQDFVVRVNGSCIKNDKSMLWQFDGAPMGVMQSTESSPLSLNSSASYKMDTEYPEETSSLQSVGTYLALVIVACLVGVFLVYGVRRLWLKRGSDNPISYDTLSSVQMNDAFGFE